MPLEFSKEKFSLKYFFSFLYKNVKEQPSFCVQQPLKAEMKILYCSLKFRCSFLNKILRKMRICL